MVIFKVYVDIIFVIIVLIKVSFMVSFEVIRVGIYNFFIRRVVLSYIFVVDVMGREVLFFFRVG